MAEIEEVGGELAPETTNITDGGDQERIIHYPRGATIFAAVACIIFIIVGIIGNLITIIALSRSIKLRVHATTAFVVSLCLSDLLFCSVNLPLTASRYITESWMLGETACRIFPFFFYGNVAASLFNMVAITLNRYILIGHNHLYSKIYRFPRIIAMVLAVWIFSFAMMMPPLLEVWGRLGLDERTFSCTILKKDGSSPKKMLFAVGILIPCVIIIVCYTLIFIKVRRSRRTIRGHSTHGSRASANISVQHEQQKTAAARKEDLRLTKMMATIFFAFLACFFPLMLVNVFDDDDVRYPTLHVIASVLAWMSAVINPFIYAFSNRQYRAAYRRLLCGSRRPNSSHSVASRSASSRTFITDVFQYNVISGKLTNKNARREDK